jgi:TonB-linked SusC/RagA family outer membrane protein
MNFMLMNKFTMMRMTVIPSCYKTTILWMLMLLFNLAASGQQEEHRVTGIILSAATDLPLNDININARNAPTDPVSSDSIGRFEIVLPGKNEQMTVSYPGYKSRIIYVDGREEINIWLLDAGEYSVEDEIQMGSGRLPGRDIIGAFASGRNLELSQITSQSVDQALQGKLAGLNATNRSGMPGEGAYMHVRGHTSLFSSGLPLLVVDGMIARAQGFPNSIINGFYPSPIVDIDINDISSVTVLKDAMETALYGVKGGHQVMLINTHPPVGGRTTLDVSVYGGIATSPRQIPLMEAQPYKSYVMEQMYNAGMSSEQIFEKYPFTRDDPEYLYYNKYNNNTSWQDEVFNNGILTNAYMRVKGGDARAVYSLSGGFLGHEGIIKNTSYNRFNFRFNSIAKISARFSIGVNLGFSSGKFNPVVSGPVYQTNPIYASLIKSPNLTIYQKNREGISLPIKEDIADFGFSNPAVLVEKVDATHTSMRFLGSAYLNYDITEKLTVRVNVGLNRDKGNEKLFIPAWGIAPQEDGSAERSMKNKVDQYISLLNDNSISYHSTFNYIHDFSVHAGMRLMFNRQVQDFGTGQNSATDEFKNLDAGRSDERGVGGFDDRWNWMNFYASARYKLKDRYMISLNTSMDGSSRFGPEVKDGIKLGGYPFAVFPSAGVAWRVSSEPFIRNINILDELKFRVSYGLTGSDDFGNYAARLYYVSNPYYSVTGYYLGGISNPALKWETVSQLNTGLDLAIFKERLILNLDYYESRTDDMITYFDLPTYYGYKQFVSNGGQCLNEGVDIHLYGRILNGKFRWEMALDYSQNRNEITHLDKDPIINTLTGAERISTVGQPFGMFYGYRSLGIFTSQSHADQANLVDKTGRPFRAGDIHFADMDGNQIINEQDKTIIGNPHPDFTGGVYNKFSFKNFSLSAHISLVSGNDVFNYMRSVTEGMTGYENQSTAVYNRWVSDGQNTRIPKASYGDPMGNARFSSRWIEDGSYVRLRNVTLAYTYPSNLGFLSGFTVFITGTNMVTWTKYLGYDPEFSYVDGILGQGMDYGKMPQSRSVIMGIKIGL